MASATTGSGGGGFMLPSALSPAPSTSTVTPSRMPKQRTHPLRAGSAKEATVINHVDKEILSINRRHAKKFSSTYEQGDRTAVAGQQKGSGIGNGHGNGKGNRDNDKERGYESFREVAKDIEALVDVLWVSGTPSLQIPYLISLAVLTNTYLPDYPFNATPTFRLLRKLDSFFASLILGEDSETGQPISGFESRRNVVSMTEKVRIKSIAETARIVVVEAGESGDADVDADAGDDLDGVEDDDDDDELGITFGNKNDDDDDFGLGDGPGKWEMETARVYEKTIQLLGDELGKAGEAEFCDEDMAKGPDDGEGDEIKEEQDGRDGA
ncbi:hypothetical protein BJY04DRAFT_211244 [Aspergillus karnatakaensis]|uniref:general transcription factor IIH subunit TFB6 family n=1 Tax=Aspergillus karnatakaensis TaxID=1810916 RepID=UPI003CCD14B2